MTIGLVEYGEKAAVLQPAPELDRGGMGHEPVAIAERGDDPSDRHACRASDLLRRIHLVRRCTVVGFQAKPELRGRKIPAARQRSLMPLFGAVLRDVPGVPRGNSVLCV